MEPTSDRILESLRAGVVAVDGGGRLVRANEQARSLLGMAPEDWRGRAAAEVLDPAVAALLDEVRSGGDAPTRAELRLRSGQAIGLTANPVGPASGAVMIFRDLAPIERQAEGERLRDRLAALGQMAAGLAHEIRNPLAAMEVSGGLLLRKLVGRAEEEALAEELLTELRRVADTLSETLAFVRPLSLHLEVVEPEGLFRLLDEALEQARGRVTFDGPVERHFAAALPAVRADPDRLRGVFAELIANAFEAQGGTGRLRLGLGEQTRPDSVAAGTVRTHATLPSVGELLVEVADDGPGIPDAARDRVFHPFFTTRDRGTGIGLAHAQKVVTSHGGFLGFESTPAGTTFRVHLPVADAEEVAA